MGMPGSYEPWQGQGGTSYPPPMSRRPMIPPMRPMRSHRRGGRRRPLTPDIVIERPSHRRSSSRRHRKFVIPLDNRPTLGLRGPPRRVIEVERVPCRRRRRRRHRSWVCEDVYDDPPQQNPQTVMPFPTNVAAPVPSLPNLTPELIERLPRQTVHLPPIHLPGSQADQNTELHTVVFPAELINPVDGTLSVIQNNTAAAAPTVPTMPRPPASAAIDPLVQRFQQLFQRLSLPQTRPQVPVPDPPIIRPTLPTASTYTPVANTMPNTTVNPGPYPSANIRPTYAVNTPSTYQPANITPYRSTNVTPSVPSYGTPPLGNSEAGPYGRANITPYTNLAARATFDPLAASTNPTPRSILRNPLPPAQSNMTYTRFNPPNVLSANNPVRRITKTAST